MALGLLALLAPLLMAGASGLGSYFGSKSRGSQGTPQLGPQNGMDALGSLGGQQPSATELPGGGKLTEFSRQNPQQQQLLSQLLSHLSGQLGQEGQDPIEAQARKQFKEVGLPELLERFTAQGSTLQGGGVRDALLRAQTDLEGNLAGRQYNMLQNLLGGALAPQQEQIFTPPEQGLFGGALKGISGGLGAALPTFAAQYGLSSLGGLG